MVKCTFCGFANEVGAAFCEKCQTDLDSAVPVVRFEARSAMNEPETAASAMTPSGGASDDPPILELAVDSPSPTISLEPVALTPPPASTPEPVEVPYSPASPPPLPSNASTSVVETPSAADLSATAVDRKPQLLVVRGQKMDRTYPLYPGKNYIGRTDDKPVDIDLDEQEASDRIWCSRQHAVITFEAGQLVIEDLNSLNGTFVNRNRVHPGQLKSLADSDVVQIGTVHLKVQFV